MGFKNESYMDQLSPFFFFLWETSYHLIWMMFFSLIYLNNKSYMDWIQVTSDVILSNITSLNIFLIGCKF